MTAQEILDANSYTTIATADTHGTPWVSPVWFAPEGPSHLLWVSDPGARHSRNIAQRPQIAVVVFDSRAAIGAAQGLYLTATAVQVHDGLAEAIAAFSAHSVRSGAAAWGPEDVTGPARLRLYGATVAERWLLGAQDRRIPVRD